MNNEEHQRTYISKNWPQLIRRIPENSAFFSYYSTEGFTNHPEINVVDKHWIHSRGGTAFLEDETIPPDFFACGVQNRYGSEYLFAMWMENGRRFWFYDQFVVYVGKSDQSCEKTSEHLDQAFGRWDRGDQSVHWRLWDFIEQKED